MSEEIQASEYETNVTGGWTRNTAIDKNNAPEKTHIYIHSSTSQTHDHGIDIHVLEPVIELPKSVTYISSDAGN